MQALLAVSLFLVSSTVVVVLDKDGKPASEATVSVSLAEFTGKPVPGFTPQRTDTNGKVDLGDLDPALMALFISASRNGETDKAEIMVKADGKFQSTVTLQLKSRDAER